ncbi:MAG: AAA family ATPase [Synechococcaceae cyanobacterium]|nr:AAA family ATPase [Synechococcaceae cyanobacterium]
MAGPAAAAGVVAEARPGADRQFAASGGVELEGGQGQEGGAGLDSTRSEDAVGAVVPQSGGGARWQAAVAKGPGSGRAQRGSGSTVGGAGGVSLVAVAGYRSLQQLVLPMGALTLITGANGTGKSNLYRALKLVVAAARGDLVAQLVAEGGLAAALWAGPETIGGGMRHGEVAVQGGPRSRPVRLRLGFAAEPFSYAITLGYPQLGGSAFQLDPRIKGEWIWAGEVFHPRALLAQRAGEGGDADGDLLSGLLGGGADPAEHPEVFTLREQVLRWRFYDGFRTDPRAPARHPGLATRTPALAGDGRDLPAALRTIEEIGDAAGFRQAIDDAFPGCTVGVDISSPTFQLAFRQPGLLRPLQAAELSDGTLRYLLLAVALFSPRLPPLLVLNEPENSLHPNLLAPLARLIAATAHRTQVWVIAHAPELVEALAAEPGCRHHRLEKQLGTTMVPGQTILERARWRWPE